MPSPASHTRSSTGCSGSWPSAAGLGGPACNGPLPEWRPWSDEAAQDGPGVRGGCRLRPRQLRPQLDLLVLHLGPERDRGFAVLEDAVPEHMEAGVQVLEVQGDLAAVPG